VERARNSCGSCMPSRKASSFESLAFATHRTLSDAAFVCFTRGELGGRAMSARGQL
jgi:hypothetical protein